MREVVGRTPLQPIISTGRGEVQRQTAEVMQRTLDSWGAGINVVEVQIRSANPPPEVVNAFRDVQSAEQDKDSSVNEANTYRNRVVNEAKGDAARIIQGAEGYREQAVREAAGEAARFNQIYDEYRRAPGVTRDRLYIETMQRILQSSNKVVIDAKGATAPIILPPDVFRPKPQAALPPPAQPQAPAAPSQPEAKARP
jgi:membrane protease subunit HflK